jgi:hypothetical protein
MESHIDVRIVERGHQGVDRFTAALRAERQCRLDPEIRIRVSHERHERVGDVDARRGQKFQRTAQETEVAVAVPQGGDDRIDQGGIARGCGGSDRRPPDLPVLVAQCRSERAQSVGPLP